MFVMKILGPANGSRLLKKHTYLKYYNVDADKGRGRVDTTHDLKEAKKFASRAEAITLWQMVSSVKPTRPDGKANRPLTAYTIEIVDETLA